MGRSIHGELEGDLVNQSQSEEKWLVIAVEVEAAGVRRGVGTLRQT